MEIPFTLKPRQDTGLYNAKLGIWLFLASEVMLFGALFSSYIVLRLGADAGMWPHGLMNIPIGTFNTAVLIISSVTVVLSWSYLKLGDFKKYKAFQFITLLCAAGFIGIKSFEYREKWHHYEVWFKEPLTARPFTRTTSAARSARGRSPRSSGTSVTATTSTRAISGRWARSRKRASPRSSSSRTSSTTASPRASRRR
jgi:hypothetical protein